MFRELIEQGLVNGFINAGDTRAALMIKSAKDQRNIQWAAEENMWISTAKAMATFFEGFVVSLVCLIPFVMFMGGLNIMLLSNYNHLADEAVGELVNLGVDRETAENLVNQYNVLTHHDDAVVSYGAAYSDFQKLSEYSKPGEEGKTMLGVNPGEVKNGELPGNPDYVSVDNKHKTPPATPTIRAFYNITHSGSDVAAAQERMLNKKR